MINQNYEYVRKRFRQFWNKENHDRPLISVFAPKDGAQPFRGKVPEKIKDRWLDFDYVVKREIHTFQNTYYGGEAFPCLNPNLGPDFFGAMLCDLDVEFGESTSWAVHGVDDWEQLPTMKFDEKNRWWKLLEELTDYAVRECKGDYLIGLTDIHSGLDALTSMKGPAEVCMDLYDCPENISKRLEECRAAYAQMMRKCFDRLSQVQEGHTNWCQIWNPDREWYITSCDFSCLISKDDFDSYVLPTLEFEWDMLGANFYHLDGVDALRHLDRLCGCEKLNGIQWVYGAGQPTARAWTDVLCRIQDAGKNIQIQVVPEDIRPLSEFLRPEGVHLTCWVGSESEAKAVVKELESAYSHR